MKILDKLFYICLGVVIGLVVSLIFILILQFIWYKKMEVKVKYENMFVKFEFLNIDYKIKSDLTKICHLTLLENKREEYKCADLIENWNKIIEQIENEKRKIKKWWKLSKSEKEIELIKLQVQAEIKRTELISIKDNITDEENILRKQLRNVKKYLDKNGFILSKEIKGMEQIWQK